ncbi:hypothetical protein [Aeoliella straminimaris]|nr:hypothetical protein [Aeoliella straminimaris]
MPGRAVWCLVLALAVMAPWAAADEPASSSVLLRNVYVPANDMAAWPTQGEAYLPVEAERLEQLLSSANADQTSGVQVLQTALYAELDQRDRLIGRGGLEVHKVSNDDSWLQLKETRVGFTQPRWRRQQSSALFGYWGPDKGTAALVEADDWLDFSWHAAPTSTTTAASEYRLELPASLASKLWLDLAEGQTVEAIGTTSLVILSNPSNDGPSPFGEPLPPVVEGKSRWLLQAGFDGKFRFRIRTNGQVKPKALDTAVYHEHLGYRVGEGGVAITQRFDIAPRGELPRLLAIRTTAGIVVRKATWDDEPLNIERTDSNLLEVVLPASMLSENGPHRLVVQAWSSLPLQTDKPLPQLELPQFYWLSGGLQVQLDPLLKVADLGLRDVVQRSPATTGQPAVLEFEKLRLRGTVDLAVARREGSNELRIARWLELSSTGVTAKVVTHWNSTSPEPVRLLRAQLRDGWQPRLVSAVGPYEVDEWYVEQHQQQRRLVVRVSIDPARLTSESSMLTLQVDAQRSVPASDAYVPLSTYDVLSWEDAKVAESWMSLAAEDGYQLQFNPTDPTPGQSAPADLVPDSTSGLVFDRSALRDNVQVFLGTAAAKFDTRLVTTVNDQQDGWEISHRIQCTPLQGSIQRLLLATAAPSQVPLRWKLQGEEQWRTVKVRPDLVPPSGVAEPGRMVELELPRRQAAPFVVLIEPYRVTSPTCRPQPLRVSDVRNATQWVKVRSSQARDLSVTARGWKMSNLEPDDGEVPLHSAWWCEQSSPAESLEVSRLGEAENLPLATLQSAVLTSTYVPQTASAHRLELVVDNQAEDQLDCILPELATGIRWHALGSDGRPLPSTDAWQHEVAIPLSGTSGRQTLVIEYTMPGQALRHAARYAAPWPQLSVPATEMVWQVRTPDAFEVVAASDADEPIGWRTRVFGWLAPGSGAAEVARTPVGGDQTLHETTLLLVPGQPASIQLLHHPTTQARQGLWLLFCAAVGYWLWRQPSWLVGLCAVAVIGALLLPPASCAWGTAALGGLMLAVAVRTLEQATHSAREAWVNGSTLSLRSTATRTLLVLVFLLGQNGIAGAPGQNIESCLIPVDGQGQIAGSGRYISARLLSELLRREQRQATSDAWVVSRPRYTGSVSSSTSATASTAAVGRWQCALELDVLQAPATVRLPFHRADATWAEVVLLDGVSVPLEWDDTGEWLEFQVSRPGHYRAKIEFQPMIQSDDTTWSVQLAVPSLPGAELRLEAGTLANRLRVNGQPMGPPNGSSQTSSLPLGCETQLSISWPQEAADPTTELVPVERWAWLDVAKDRATLDVIYQLDAAQADELMGDLTMDGRPAMVEPPATVPAGQWRLIAPPQLTTAADRSRKLSAQLEQLRPDTNGRLLLPNLRWEGTTLQASHVAIGESPDLMVTLAGTVSEGSELLTELAQHWPRRDEPSQLLTVDRNAAALVATVAPVSSPPRIEETLDVLATSDRLQFTYRGILDYGRQETYSQWLSCAPEMDLQSIELREDGEVHATDFARPERNRLLIIFAEPVTGTCELRVTGSVPLKQDAAVDTSLGQVPRVSAALDAPVTQQVRLYAADECTAELVEGEVEPQLSTTIPTPPANWHAYGIRSFMTSSERTIPLEVRVGPNRVRFDADVLTTMIRRDNIWIAEFGVLLTVAEGNLPDIVLDWPATLADDAKVDGSVEALMEPPSSTGGDRRLHLRFDPAAMPNQQLRVTLRSTVRMQSSNHMQYPIIHVRDASNTSWYFGELADDAGRWNWQGAKPDVAPASIEGLLAAWPSAKLLKATPGAQPVGIWTAKGTNDQVYQLPLATIAVQRTDGDRIVMKTQFVVPPLDLETLDVHLPVGQRATQVTIDGVAAHAADVDANHLRIELPDAHLPHFVEVATLQTANPASTSVEIPQLLAGGRRCEVQHAVWRVSGLGREVNLTAPGAEERTAAETAALRLTQLLSASIGSPPPATQPMPSRWAKRWMAELAAAESDLRRSLAAQSTTDAALVNPEAETDEFDLLLARATAEIKRTSAAAQLQVGSISAVSDMLKASDPTSQVFVQSGAETLVWSEVRVNAADRLTRWALALSAALLAGAFLVSRQRDWSLPVSGYELLFPAVTVLGFAWWLCLWPPQLGLVIAVAALVAWVRWRTLTRTQATEEASTITLSAQV